MVVVRAEGGTGKKVVPAAVFVVVVVKKIYY